MPPAMSKSKEIGKSKMIKTLRITGIITAVLAVVFLVFPVVFGVRSDEEVEQSLRSAGVVEEFNKIRGAKAEDSESQTSPLVKQAEAFALYLNPPPKPERAAASRRPGITHRPPAVSAKFKLIGTCVHASDPEMSVALIDEPGKGFRWVRQSGRVGHLVIERVKDGVVVVRDGKRTFELVAARPDRRSLVKGKRASPGETGSEPALSVLDEAGAEIMNSEFSQMSPEEQEAWAEKFFAVLEAMAAGEPNESGEKADSELSVEESAELENLIETMRVSDEEAEKLNHLGEELKDVQHDPNRNDDRGPERRASSHEPNSPEEK